MAKITDNPKKDHISFRITTEDKKSIIEYAAKKKLSIAEVLIKAFKEMVKNETN